MTPEEALEVCKLARDRIIDDDGYLNTVIQALEKQIPKKMDDGRCPFCGKFEISSDMGYDYPFCHDCGQALDWR